MAVAPDLLLRQLDPEPLGASAERINQALRPMYEAMSSGAAAVTIGDDEVQPSK